MNGENSTNEKLTAVKTDGTEIVLDEKMEYFGITRDQLKRKDPIDPITPMTADFYKVRRFLKLHDIGEINKNVFAEFFGIGSDYARELLIVINRAAAKNLK